MTTATLQRGAGATAPAPAGYRSRQWRRRLVVLSFLAPWLLGTTIFFIYPLIDTLYLSFTRYDLLSQPVWVGLHNYVFMFTKDQQLRQAAVNTLWLTVVLVPARMLFALAVATLMVRLKSGKGIFRTVFYLPALVPPVAGVVELLALANTSRNVW